jgi:LPXTG-motif cell wall-anchored protein
LPNTGAGDVLGIFAGASSIGAAGHFIVARKRR